MLVNLTSHASYLMYSFPCKLFWRAVISAPFACLSPLPPPLRAVALRLTAFPVWEDIAERAGPCKPLLQRLYKHVMREKQHKADANFYLNMLACCAYTADVNLAEELT